MSNNLPSTQSVLNQETSKHIGFMRVVTGGTELIRSKKETYLPKYNREDNDDYEDRLKNSELLPATAEAVKSISGKLLLTDTVLEDINDVFDEKNIDNMGTDFKTFENTLVNTGVTEGLVFILIDFPIVEGVITKADEEKVNAKPYYSMIKADKIINYRTATINNETVLSQVTIEVDYIIQDGDFGEKDATKFYVYKNDNNAISVDLWENSGERNELAKISSTTIRGITEIPLVPFYTNRKDFFKSPSILTEMAVLNVSWYRLNSAYKRSIERACDPTPVIKGSLPLDENGQQQGLSVGSSQILLLDDESNFEWVSAGSDFSIPTKDEIISIETRMGKIATELLNSTREMTATEANISNTDTEAKLNYIATSKDNALNRAYEFYCDFARVEPTGVFISNRDFSSKKLTSEQVVNLRSDMLSGIITKETYLQERQKGGELLGIKDIEAEIIKAEDEVNLSTQDTFN